MADFETVKLVGGPLAKDVRVELPSGETIPNVTRIEIDPLEPGGLISVKVTLLARVDLAAMTEAK